MFLFTQPFYLLFFKIILRVIADINKFMKSIKQLDFNDTNRLYIVKLQAKCIIILESDSNSQRLEEYTLTLLFESVDSNEILSFFVSFNFDEISDFSTLDPPVMICIMNLMTVVI